jgi:hypothetical protein
MKRTHSKKGVKIVFCDDGGLFTDVLHQVVTNADVTEHFEKRQRLTVISAQDHDFY